MGSSGINAVHGDRDISRLQVAQTLSSSTAFIHYIDPLSFFGLCKITFSHSFHLQSRLVRFAITVPTSQPDEETRLPFREKFLSYLQHVCEESRCHQRARRCCCCCAHGQERHCLGDGDACEHRHRPGQPEQQPAVRPDHHHLLPRLDSPSQGCRHLPWLRGCCHRSLRRLHQTATAVSTALSGGSTAPKLHA